MANFFNYKPEENFVSKMLLHIPYKKLQKKLDFIHINLTFFIVHYRMIAVSSRFL